jgi:hypothetical protein
LDFGARIYDSRVGKWLSMDPKAAKYPYFSPYVAFGDNPNIFIDPGGETLRVHGTTASANKFKGQLEKQFAGKVVAEMDKNAANILSLRLVDGAELSPSQMALFNEVNSSDITNIGLISGNETMNVVINGERVPVSSDNVWVGARGDNMQILDLNDLETIEEIGTAEGGLGATVGGSIGHEVGEANKWQNHKSELGLMPEDKAHQYGTDVENSINGTQRDVKNDNFKDYKLKGSSDEGKIKGVLFGTVHMRYIDKDGSAKSVNYEMNRTSPTGVKPTVTPDHTPESSRTIPDGGWNEVQDE